MQYDRSSPPARVVRLPRRGRRLFSRHRAWRRRSRRAQVSAVATLLGLLLVVTFIASYISTELPNQMGQNDLQRDVLVQNQVSQFAAYVQSVAVGQVVGAQVSTPVSLGSAGAPPFAGQDSGSVSAGNQSGSFEVNFTLQGPSVFSLPVGYPQGGTWTPMGVTPYCTPSSPVNALTCTGAGNAHYNFAGNAETFTIGVTGTGFTAFNISANRSSSIAVTDTGSGGLYLQIIGSNDTIVIAGTGSGPSNITILGNHDTISIAPVGSSPVTLLVVGNNDPITFPTGTGSQTILLKVYGSTDPISAPDFTGSQKAAVYYNGFNAYSPTSSLCPFANLSSTQSATFGGTGTVGLKVFYNNSVGYTAQKWQNSSCTGTCYFGQIYQNVARTTCPYFSPLVLPIGSAPISYGSFVVALHNTYAPAAEVAFDQGAVIYAQPDGFPIFIVPPRVSFSHEVLTIFLPHFTGPPGSESGVGTADVSARLVSVNQLQLPGPQFSLQSHTQITLTIVSPYAAAWYNYFLGFAGLSSYVSCAGSNSVCTALYLPGGPLGTVTLRIPVAGISLNLLVGLFAVTVG